MARIRTEPGINTQIKQLGKLDIPEKLEVSDKLKKVIVTNSLKIFPDKGLLHNKYPLVSCKCVIVSPVSLQKAI